MTESDGTAWGWAAMVLHRKKVGTEGGGQSAKLARESNEPDYTIDVLVKCDPDQSGKTDMLDWKTNERSVPFSAGTTEAGEKKKPDYRIRTLTLDSVMDISAVKLVMPDDVHPKQSRSTVGKSIRQVHKAYPTGPPPLDYLDDMKIKEQDFQARLNREDVLTKAMNEHAMANFR